mmetsp:Transcript_23135/g.23023  ORF Transcript_23135/g.23023 Transcript_23135/m.23023 type:complete len:153 (-) Transcript_23135:143-601(-)
MVKANSKDPSKMPKEDIGMTQLDMVGNKESAVGTMKVESAGNSESHLQKAKFLNMRELPSITIQKQKDLPPNFIRDNTLSKSQRGPKFQHKKKTSQRSSKRDRERPEYDLLGVSRYGIERMSRRGSMKSNAMEVTDNSGFKSHRSNYHNFED